MEKAKNRQDAGAGEAKDGQDTSSVRVNLGLPAWDNKVLDPFKKRPNILCEEAKDGQDTSSLRVNLGLPARDSKVLVRRGQTSCVILINCNYKYNLF